MRSLGFLGIATFLALLAPPLALGAAGGQAGVVAPRPKVGVAFGGGSARGIAHVGVIRWLDEHHVPIDVAAGTSMGGLIGGAFATGMSADEIETMLAGVDWDAMFGSSNFAVQERPPQARRAGLPVAPRVRPQAWLVAPTSLNNGQQVELLLGAHHRAVLRRSTFDELPTPFRAVAVDLRTAKFVVLDQRPARAGDARDDVAAAHLPAGRVRGPRARGRRRA